MHRDTAHEIDRRSWLAGCARTVVLGGIAATAGVLASRGQVRSCPDESLVCANCGRLARCGLPRAVVVRAQHAKQEKR